MTFSYAQTVNTVVHFRAHVTRFSCKHGSHVFNRRSFSTIQSSKSSSTLSRMKISEKNAASIVACFLEYLSRWCKFLKSSTVVISSILSVSSLTEYFHEDLKVKNSHHEGKSENVLIDKYVFMLL